MILTAFSTASTSRSGLELLAVVRKVPLPLRRISSPFVHQLLDGLADGHPAHTQLGSQFPLSRDRLIRLELPGADALQQVIFDLQILFLHSGQLPPGMLMVILFYCTTFPKNRKG